MAESIRAGALQGFDQLVRELGGDPGRLLRQNGLDQRSLRNPESMVSLARVALLVEDAARTLHLPTFGLRVGSLQDAAVLGPLAVVIRNTNTVHEAILKASRYLFIHSPSYEVSLEDPSRHLPGCITLRFDIKLEGAVPQRQLIDGFLASTYRLAQLLSPNPIRLRGVSIPHTPTGPRDAYRSFFDAPVSFEQPYAGLHLGREILQSRMGDIAPYLREQALAYVASHQPPTVRLLSGRVRSALKSTVGANRGTKGEIAELLNLHPRTLQRRLTGEGSTFEDIRTEVYRAATRRLLLETEIPLSQVAAALGFSEQSAMNRSVKRWFDATPAQLRRTGTAASLPQANTAGEADRRALLLCPRVSVLSSASANRPPEELSKFMTAAAEASALESRVGHYYQMDGTYLVGREKLREYARAVQDYNPAHWDVAAAAELGYSDLVAPLTFTSTPGMTCNRHMFEQVVVGYDTYMQTEEVFEQHRPIVAGDELHVDVELTSVRRIAGRDLITVTNTFTDMAGERVHTLHTTVVGLTAEDLDPAIKTAVQNTTMHDMDIFGVGEEEYHKTVRPEGEVRIAEGGTTRTPGTPSFDDVKVGDELPVRHTRLSRGDLVNYSGVAGDGNPIHWDEGIAKLAGLPDVIAHGMLTMGLGAGFASAWTGDPGAVTRYAVRLSAPAIVSAAEGADIEFGGRIKSLDPATRSGVVLVTAKSDGRKIFGLATLDVRFR